MAKSSVLRIALSHVGLSFKKGGTHPQVFNDVIKNLSSKQRIDEAVYIVTAELGKFPDIRSYNILLQGCFKQGEIYKADEILKSLHTKGLQPNVDTYYTVIDELFYNEKPKTTESYFSNMIKQGLKPDSRVYNLMHTKGLQPNVDTYYTVIDGLFYNGKPKTTESYFFNMIKQGLKPDSRVYNLMHTKGLQPNVETYYTVIDGLFYNEKSKTAESYFSNMIKQGLKPDSRVYNCLINGLIRKGEKAEETKEVHKFNNVCYCDGSWKKYKGAGIGYIIYKQGRLVCYKSSQVVACDSFEAECLALKEAIDHVTHLRLTSCTFYTDCMELVKACTLKKRLSENMDMAKVGVVLYIKKRLSENRKYKCKHVGRLQNQDADMLAKMGRIKSWTNYVGYTYPILFKC